MGRRVPGFLRSTWSATRAATPPGSTIFTLTVTDIATGWTVNRSVRKAAKWVFEALEHVLAVFPFPIIGIDSDNGSEFINDHLLRVPHRAEVHLHPAPSGRQQRRLTRGAEELGPGR